MYIHLYFTLDLFEVEFIDLCFTFAYDKVFLLSSCFLLACFECTPCIIWERHCNIYYISALCTFMLFIIFMRGSLCIHLISNKLYI